MTNSTTSAAAAGRAPEPPGSRCWRRGIALAALVLHAGCAAEPSGVPLQGAAPQRTITSASELAQLGPVPPPGVQTTGEARTAASAIPAAVGARNQAALLPMEEAVARAAEAMLANAQLPAGHYSGGRAPLVIDPLIDGATGAQSTTTRSVQARVAEVARKSTRFELLPFNTTSLERKPLVVLGSVMPLRPNNALIGSPTAYDLWLVLADMRTGRIVGRAEAPMRLAGIDPMPTLFFRDSPAWVQEDPVQRGYWETCRAVVGEAVDQRYLDSLFASALVADGINAYEAGQPWRALTLYQRAAQLPGGDQTRVHNGLFLTNWQLGRQQDAEAAFARLVDLGLRQGQVAVKLLFQPGSTAFWPDANLSGTYPMFLRRIGYAAVTREACLRVTGHTSPTGSVAVNERLSLARAERVRDMLLRGEQRLERRVAAEGLGSRAPIIGTGSDDASDALDRRVEFAPVGCGTVVAAMTPRDGS